MGNRIEYTGPACLAKGMPAAGTAVFAGDLRFAIGILGGRGGSYMVPEEVVQVFERFPHVAEALRVGTLWRVGSPTPDPVAEPDHGGPPAPLPTPEAIPPLEPALEPGFGEVLTRKQALKLVKDAELSEANFLSALRSGEIAGAKREGDPPTGSWQMPRSSVDAWIHLGGLAGGE